MDRSMAAKSDKEAQAEEKAAHPGACIAYRLLGCTNESDLTIRGRRQTMKIMLTKAPSG
jgi:hypothetical protein